MKYISNYSSIILNSILPLISIIRSLSNSVKLCWYKIIDWLHAPQQPYCLATFRIGFGILLLVDTFHERRWSRSLTNWSEDKCYFPAFSLIKPLSPYGMLLLYPLMAFACVCLILGWRVKQFWPLHVCCYWYMFLLSKPFWNNHSYLFGLMSAVMLFTDADEVWSLKSDKKRWVPRWNYFIIRFQLFLVYFYAGLKKTENDWLMGYSMSVLRKHWLFDPLRFILSDYNINLWIVHRGGFLYDLLVGFLLLNDKTKTIGVVLSILFHGMNSILFSIGMFPYVMLLSICIFFSYSFPLKSPPKLSVSTKNKEAPSSKKQLIVLCMGLYMAIQMFLPFSHFITKGYNGWTEGSYGYSWDMMVHSTHVKQSSFIVHNKDTGDDHYINVENYFDNRRWWANADMILTGAECIRKDFARAGYHNIAIYPQVWNAMNKRLSQRVFDPNTDLLTAEWSPFKTTEWSIPIIKELDRWRPILMSIGNKASQNRTYFTGMADFPGLPLKIYIDNYLRNFQVEVLKGKISAEIPGKPNSAVTLNPGEKVEFKENKFYTITVTSTTPAIYTFKYQISTKSKKKEPEHWTESFRKRVSLVTRAAYNSIRLSYRAFTMLIQHLYDKTCFGNCFHASVLE